MRYKLLGDITVGKIQWWLGNISDPVLVNVVVKWFSCQLLGYNRYRLPWSACSNDLIKWFNIVQPRYKLQNKSLAKPTYQDTHKKYNHTNYIQQTSFSMATHHQQTLHNHDSSLIDTLLEIKMVSIKCSKCINWSTYSQLHTLEPSQCLCLQKPPFDTTGDDENTSCPPYHACHSNRGHNCLMILEEDKGVKTSSISRTNS
jgi:hypothetical protein